MDMRVEGLEELSARLLAVADSLPVRADRALDRSARILQSGLQREFLSGQYLRVLSDKARGGWQVHTPPPTGQVVTKVLANPWPHVRAHEFGFTGAVNVREHMRRVARPASGKPTARERRLGSKGQARLTAERAVRQHDRVRARRRGPRLRALREERRRRGLQAGVAARASHALREKAAVSGRVVVRAHGRWMRLRARHFVRDALVRFEPQMIGEATAVMTEGF